MRRKSMSLRRWKARFQLGRFIPYVVCVEYPALHEWIKRQRPAYQINRDGYVKA